ncbi:hypothetical protein COCMIDRAFT_24245 [Bipolaris oryzae ATCC 44560]|uniref:Uncharacterized protein n=1 Tax=Bipolaris oryzae ATCC 44560 TaxID=930090 RepID=W6Z7Z7_COCMI|nr:uncharacterized protein COCMIDRAFT_24245 [Bipolaris oryzae ATCC 44560]EUC47847.1 hypothetical protein COCMIDRAFT_24245 [Bipolaris oryzae ATCC 44560]
MKLISATLTLLLSAAPTLAAVGGRCSNNWGAECICLDSDECSYTWGGTPYTGTSGNWPCPSDPENIVGCVIPDCPGHGSDTQCLWRDGCQSVNPDPVCPGGDDFVCCNHKYGD